MKPVLKLPVKVSKRIYGNEKRIPAVFLRLHLSFCFEFLIDQRTFTLFLLYFSGN